MNKERITYNKLETKRTGVEMYFNPEVAKTFAELEQNEKNFKVAQIVDRVLIDQTKGISAPIQACELGGGAHPDRYNQFFAKLLQQPKGNIDWVDVSPHMLLLADEYISTNDYSDRKEVITYIESDILKYLEGLEDESLDVAIMKYTIGHISDVSLLFALLQKKLKKGGKLVSTMGALKPTLKSYSTNARFLYNGQQFADDETRTLVDGDTFTVKFFAESGNPNGGYMPGAETTKYYHSTSKITQQAETNNFDIFLGNWKDLIDIDSQQNEEMDQAMLVLTKR